MSKKYTPKDAALELIWRGLMLVVVILTLATAFGSMYPPSPLAPIFHNPDPNVQASSVLYLAIIASVAMLVYAIIAMLIYRSIEGNFTHLAGYVNGCLISALALVLGVCLISVILPSFVSVDSPTHLPIATVQVIAPTVTVIPEASSPLHAGSVSAAPDATTTQIFSTPSVKAEMQRVQLLISSYKGIPGLILVGAVRAYPSDDKIDFVTTIDALISSAAGAKAIANSLRQRTIAVLGFAPTKFTISLYDSNSGTSFDWRSAEWVSSPIGDVYSTGLAMLPLTATALISGR